MTDTPYKMETRGEGELLYYLQRAGTTVRCHVLQRTQ
jgi:hypothetical protein